MGLTKYVVHELAQEQITPYDWRKLQDILVDTFNDITSREHLDLYLIADIEISAGVETWIAHGLKRIAQGYLVVKRDAPAMDYWIADSSADLTKYIPIALTLDATISILVF